MQQRLFENATMQSFSKQQNILTELIFGNESSEKKRWTRKFIRKANFEFIVIRKDSQIHYFLSVILLPSLLGHVRPP